MHSRAFLLLKRDLVNLERFPLTGIVAQPQNENLFSWNAKIEGLSGTLWEGGVFQIQILFNEEFNYKVPEVHFMTIPFHPNVDARNGRPALPEGNWSEESTVASLLLSLQSLLSNPELDEGCIRNPAAAKLLKEVPLTYKQMALDCVTASLRVDAGLTPYDSDSSGWTPTPGRTPLRIEDDRLTREKNVQLKPVSFDDYHMLWRGIATSITGYQKPNNFLSLLENDQHLSHVHCRGDQMQISGVQHKKTIETAPLEQKVNDHILLKYGKSGKSNTTHSVGQVKSRAQRIEQLKQMYRRGMGLATAPESTTADSHGEEESREGERLDEVDQLLQWTENLDEKILNACSTPGV